ncbi:SMI1/KNR4 family protein [Streptomyces sp. XD-27]|uniref:SMI1/KNR4 family protein n=1 Tax=Streptomyces sp. XD-27 TaxID=3062779 RepID=UPI0026F4164D|nr:SMI1/KNR4 family protein [Streptomyces sp. XD-27]WKX68691.1 SMI1/KNR4 family protein [Streptomyces sp. XD-27]
MTETTFDWQSFLTRWSEEWADSYDPDESPHGQDEDDAEARRDRWLGFPPASGARIAATEERLGHRLPPSYRAFLEVSDGWRHAGGFVWLLAGTEEARWHEDESGLGEMYQEDLDEDSLPEEVLEAGMWDRALQLDVESDSVYVLLDPGDVGDGGEWAVYCYKSWAAMPPERYASFREFMEDMYREFHMLRADRPENEFANDTTRKLDAAVEDARREALRGEYERAETAFAEAAEYGRPRARALCDQIRRLQGHTSMVDLDELAADPVYAPEVLPVLAVDHVENGHDAEMWSYHVRGASDEVREAADGILRQVRKGSYRYTASGPFGRAVDRAREQARWGAADAAWRTLLAALPRWRPLGPDHLAPLGLLADPVLGPLVTPERGRELLATTRGGEPGEAPAPTMDLDPGGLAWLAEPEPGRSPESYRFILVEGVDPADLPALVGADENAVLHEPMTSDARWELRSGRGSSSYDDKALASVGRAGPGWSFAFDEWPSPFDERRFTSPAVAASRGGRAVVVWSAPAASHGSPELFHLSVAENGEEAYAFTIQGTTIRRSGTIPAALDPDRLFAPEATEGTSDADTVDADTSDADAARLGERRALEAIAAEFGVSLPRFTLTHGRLHTVTTRSWTRPPGPGEGYIVVRLGWQEADEDA